jgi:PAS domain S-box-containing protein
MNDQDKTGEQLVSENEELRQQVAGLQEREQRFRKFFHQDLIGMAAVTVDGQWLEINDRLCEILGYPKDDLLRKTWKDLSHPDDLKSALSNFQRLISGEVDHYIIDKRYVRKDGSTVYTTIAVQAFHREDGAIDCVVGLMEDITAKKQAENALQQSHDELQAIYDGMVDGLLVTDIETLHFVRANASICRMLGYSETELRSLSVKDIHPAEALPYILERIRSIEKANQIPAGDIPFLRKDGSVFYAEVIGKLLAYNGKPCSMGIFRDITERRQVQEALRRSEERYRTVVEDQTEVICRFKADGTYIFINDVYCRFFGKSSQELLGSKWQPVALPDDVPMIEEQPRAMSPHKPIVVIENRVYSGTGEVRWMQFVNRGFFDQEGRLTEIQSVGRDITERKRAQDALERERQSLWRMLQASDHERQIISYEIHDGLAQYLAAATMQFQTYDSLRQNSPDEAQKAYETAVELVRQAHFESRRLISEVRPPVIDEIGLETAISHLVHEQRLRNGLAIKFDSDVQFGRLSPILENALYRIVQEALTNACKHSKSKKVTVLLGQEDQDVRLEVRDWGIGFDPESVEKGRFGLESIRQRVRLLGGRLSIESKPDSGTLFRVVVPILEKPIED